MSSQLDPETYALLRSIAAGVLSRRTEAVLQPTVLLHEAWLKLERSGMAFESRSHFLAVAAKAMRQILVNHAEALQADKRGGGWRQTTLAGLPGDRAGEPVDLLTLHAALAELEQLDPRCAEVVQLRVFGGLTVAETARVLAVSTRTVNSDWRFARAWLMRALSG